MSSATQLGISEREYEEALAVEKLFFLSSRERCNYCSSGKPTFVDTYNYEFICDRCSFRSKHKKRIGEDSISFYDVQKLEKKFGVASSSNYNSRSNHRRKSSSGHHHHHHRDHSNEKKSKSKSRHTSGKKHIDVVSDDNSSSYDYEEKIRKGKKKKKDKEKDRSGADRDRDRRKDKHNKDKYRKKKKYDDSDEDFDDDFCLNDYDHTTPGMIGIMNSNNINNSDYKSNNMDSSFQDFDGSHISYNQLGEGSFNDFGPPNGMNHGGINQGGMNQSGLSHADHPFDSPHFAKDNYNSKYMNSPNAEMVNAANNQLCLDDFNSHHFNNKMGYSNNFNMKMNEEGEMGKMKYGNGGQANGGLTNNRAGNNHLGHNHSSNNHHGNNKSSNSNKINMHSYDPFDNNVRTGADKNRYNNGAVENLNYFNGSNFPNNQQGSMTNRLFLMNKRNSLNHNYSQQNSNASSMYSHFATKQNPYMMNNQNMINAKMLYDNNMNSSKNKNFHSNNPNSPFMLNGGISGGTISNANNGNSGQGSHSNNMNNAMAYCNQGNLNDRTKWHDNGSSNNNAINSSNGGGGVNPSSNNNGGSNSADFSPVIVSDKNPFSLQNIISNKKSPNYMNTTTDEMNRYMYK
ncbi:hypothetical protein C922_00642 [Plasmodium inui San Antonio 1]|uniref:Uncharacterized protein n=1 Tax=Plasmodium inui San Antonio 1 TaxID=1237626 RepID=W7AU49_9APIC|nr:hypothetical protein C922_00642 [Plasmodium inui San Antonio 1]EUD68951.1 hypothetical protein C922_00642 [Plasmodium inui San Antonio 1]